MLQDLLNLFEKKLKYFEKLNKNKKVEFENVHEAQMLLKEILDLKDQGYIQSYNTMSTKIDAVNRLTNFITSNGYKIIKPLKNKKEKDIAYTKQAVPFQKYEEKINKLLKDKTAEKSENNLINDIYNYSLNLFKDYNKDTAYVFLLRDTLLPYLAFKEWTNNNNINNVYPWIVCRKFLAQYPSEENLKQGIITGPQSANFGDNDDAYEMIYKCIFTALDKNNKSYKQFIKNTSKLINIELDKNYKNLKNNLKELLSTIKQKHIIVVESGRFASIPLLLRAIDKRVDFRLFTTTPQFYNVYKNRYFTNEYDKNRLFETLKCQDSLFVYSGYNNGNFMVRGTTDKEIIKLATSELAKWNELISK